MKTRKVRAINLKCETCVIMDDKACEECKDFKLCEEAGSDWHNPPKDYPFCWKCNLSVNNNCTLE